MLTEDIEYRRILWTHNIDWKQVDGNANKFWENFIAKETMSLAFNKPCPLKSFGLQSYMSRKQVAKTKTNA